MQTQPDPMVENNATNQSQVSQRHSSGVGEHSDVRKSARFQEQEDQSKTASKKSFRETMKFDASLYQSGDDEDSADDYNQPMHTNQT